MYTLITFATEWGSKHGGINSFNADFLTAFGIAYYQNAQIVCIVTQASPEATAEAAKANVKLLPLPYAPKERDFDSSIGESGVDWITKSNIKFDPDQTIWLGHDMITGGAAIAAATATGGRSAVIHHMSYNDYESIAEDSQSAHSKTEQQTTILEKADIVLAVGPLLRDAAIDRLGALKPVRMLVPGLPEIEPLESPKAFVAFLSGRLSADAARIKQGHLGIAAFAAAARKARIEGVPEALRRQPKLLLRGVDFENRFATLSPAPQDAESQLKKFAEEYGEAVINLHALPYTEDKQQLYRELSRSTVALMPSWHEGFGLVAWEAIASGVPLVVGQNSGVYRYLEEEYPGAEKGYVYSVDVKGQTESPYFRKEDLEATVEALRTIAIDPAKARKKASSLRNLLLEKNSWVSCCENAVAAFDWELKKGSVGDRSSVIAQHIATPIHSSSEPIDVKTELLKIPQKQWRVGTGMADSQLLRAEEAILAFDAGRDSDVEELKDWVNDQALPITVRLITGAGGQGKTRLAIHTCQQVRTSGWYAGFLDTNMDLGRMRSLFNDLRSLNQPILIVVDYAETRQTAFLTLIKLALLNSMDHPLRILLLARDSGEWWDNLPGRDSTCEALLGGSATTGPFKLAALYETRQQREQAFAKALQAFAGILEAETPELKPELAGEQFARPLFIQMAALLALYGERPVTSQGLTKALLNHERRYWVRLLEPLNWPDAGQRAEQLLALVTLAGGFPTAKTAETFWAGANGSAITTSEFNSLFRSLATLYPATQGLQALRPDLLGEALVAQALLRSDGDVLLDAVLGSAASQSIRRNALTVLSRLSNERVDVDEVVISGLSRKFAHCSAEVIAVSTETVSRLPELASVAFESLSPGIKSQLVGSLVKTLPDESVQLGGFISLVFGYQAKKVREKLSRKPGNLERMLEYAIALDRYGVRLAFSGNYSKACEIAEESVSILRRLVVRDRNRFSAYYAAALGNYSNRLSENGRGEEATEIIREVLESYTLLNKQTASRFEREYATSLANSASLLADLGQSSEALAQSKEALEIRRRLASRNPAKFNHDYSNSLNNHANRLSDVGQYQEALRHSKEALTIRKRLALKTPDRFEPDYAGSLINHGNRLLEIGQSEEALAHTRDALRILERLSFKSPDRFDSDYSASLDNYANCLCDVGQHEEALLHSQKALLIIRRIAEKNPERFEQDYATSLTNYANHLSHAGFNEEALVHSQEAIEISRRLAKKTPDRFEPDYAMFLSNHAGHLSNLGQTTEAVEHSKGALLIRTQLALKNPDRFDSDYATSLGNYAGHLSDIGQYDEALGYSKKALQICQRLAQKIPDRFEPDFARSLSNHANLLINVGQYQIALENAKGAQRIHQRLLQRMPRTFAHDFLASKCLLALLVWLTDHDASEVDEDLDQITFSLIPNHEQRIVRLYVEFTRGCRATEFSLISRGFGNVLTIWADLSRNDRRLAEDFRLCAACWSSRFEQLIDSSWQKEWLSYSTQRDGNVPVWLLEVARRLDFEFPDVRPTGLHSL